MSWLWPKRSLTFVLEQPTWILTEELGWRSLSSMGWGGGGWSLLRCTAPRSQKLMFLIILGMSGCKSFYIKLMYVGFMNIEREIERDWRVEHNFEANWRKKNSALCGTKGKKKRWFFFCSRHTRKINWGFSLKRLFGSYNHKELKYSMFYPKKKYSMWKILLPAFVVRFYLFLGVWLYFLNLLWTLVLGITWVL